MDCSGGERATMLVMEELKRCQRCGGKYEWKKSNSALKMTYCGLSCEIGGLGWSLEALEKGIIVARTEEASVEDISPLTDDEIRRLTTTLKKKADDDDRPLVPV